MHGLRVSECTKLSRACACVWLANVKCCLPYCSFLGITVGTGNKSKRGSKLATSLEEDVDSGLRAVCGKRKATETSPASAGEARKVRKPVASDEQRAGVQAVLCEMCGEEPDLWNTKKWVVEAVQCSSVGMELQAAGATVAHLQTLIWNLKQNALYQNSPHVRATKSAYSSEPHVRAARSAYYSGVSDAARMHTFQASSLAAQKFTMPLTAEAQAVQVARAIELGKEDLDAASLSRASTYVGLSKLRYFHHSCLTHSDIVVTAQL